MGDLGGREGGSWLCSWVGRLLGRLGSVLVYLVLWGRVMNRHRLLHDHILSIELDTWGIWTAFVGLFLSVFQLWCGTHCTRFWLRVIVFGDLLLFIAFIVFLIFGYVFQLWLGRHSRLIFNAELSHGFVVTGGWGQSGLIIWQVTSSSAAI